MQQPPPRLIEDPAIGRAMREDLAHASEQHQAYAAAYTAANSAAGFQAALASQASGVALGTIGKAALGIVGAAALMLAGAGLHARWQDGAEREAPSVRTPASVTVAPAPAPALAPSALDAPPAPAPVVPADTRDAMRGAKPGAPDATQHELRQLTRVRAYLRAGDSDKALQLAERGHRELGESALWQEREGLAVLALFELGRATEAERRARVLLDRFPSSPFRGELEQHLHHAHEP